MAEKYREIELKQTLPQLQSVEKTIIDKCYIEWDIIKKKQIAKEKYKEAQKKAREIRSIKKSLKAGLGAFASGALAELTAAVGYMASQLVAAAAGAVSGVIGKAIELIFNQLLKIIMAGPESLFALIKLPLDKAIMHTERERNYLINAKTNLKIIIRIMSKYLSGFDSDKYFISMKKAMPYIDKSIQDTHYLISTLRDGKRFDDDKFNDIITNLDLAIKETIPRSVLLQKTGVDQAIERSRQENRDAADAKNKAWYDKEKSKLDEAYRRDMKRLQNSLSKAQPTDRLKRDVINSKIQTASINAEISAIDAQYQGRLTLLKTSYDAMVERDRAKAEVQSFDVRSKKFASITASAQDKVVQEFSDDVDLLSSNLKLLLSNIKDAFLEYKMSQFYTGSTYTSVSRIKSLIQWIINKYKENIEGKIQNKVVSVLEVSEGLSTDVYSKFLEDTDKWTKGEIKAANMSIDLTKGNIKLQMSSSLLSATITKSVIEMLNFDDLLITEKERFLKFAGSPTGDGEPGRNIYDIKDFKGNTGVWGTNDFEGLSELTTYLSLIQQIGFTLASAPVKMFSPDKQDKEELKKIMYNIDSKFNEIIDHNNTVINVLLSYRPYQSGMVNELKRLIDALIPFLSAGMMALDIVNALKQLNEAMSIKDECGYMWAIWDKTYPTQLPVSVDSDKNKSATATAASSASGEAADEWEPVNKVSPVEGAKDGEVPSSLGLMANDDDDIDDQIRKKYYQ